MKGNAGNDIPERTGFLQIPPVADLHAVHVLLVHSKAGDLHHPVPIKPALEVKIVDAGEEVI